MLSPAPGVEQTREHDDRRYRTSRRLVGEDVLLVDDMWTTGADAQSAASTLKRGGASTVGIMVIDRHFNRKTIRGLPGLVLLPAGTRDEMELGRMLS